MARLPVPGSDDGTWGDILNDYLSAQHNADGTHDVALNDLTDVSTAGAANGQVLTYNSGSWAPAGGGAGDPAMGGDLTGTASTAQIAAGAIVNADINASAAIAQSKIANLTTDLAAKADETITVSGGTSLTGGGDLTANRTLTLVNDAATPGSSRYYGTDGAGAKGFHALPAGDPAMGGDLTGTASNAQIAAGAIVDADVNASAAIAQSKVANLTTDLAGKLDTKNNVVALTDSTNDDFARFNITDDASPTGSWPDRFAFYFDGTRTGYHNEYGELRARPGKDNTVALRAMKWSGVSTADIFQVTDSDLAPVYFGVSPDDIDVSVPMISTSTITATNLLYTSDKGAANGVAGLDAGTKVPVAQLPDATTLAKGIVQLAGDLGGTAASPTVPGLASKINTSEKGAANGVAELDGTGKIIPGQLATANITKLVPYSYTGTLAVTTGAFRLYNDMGATWTISGVRASVGTAPAGASIIVDIHKNGTTIFTTQANRPTIAIAANTSGNVTNMDVTTVAAGEYLTVDIDQIGSTTAGADLTVQIEVV